MKTHFPIMVAAVLFGAISAHAQQYASAGALRQNGQWEVGVHFEENVDTVGVLQDSRYVLQGGEVSTLRFEPLSRSVILGVTLNNPDVPASLQLNGFTTTNGVSLPSTTLEVKPGKQSWTVIGANELGLGNQAIPYGDGKLDLISGAVQMFSRYDEAIFVYERVTGDFDIKTRVIGQEATTLFAKAGLMIRENLDSGRARPADNSDPAQAFSRYISVQVNPAETVDPLEAGNNQYEVAFRPYLGGIGSPSSPTEYTWSEAPVTYPNAWLRLVRTGNSVAAHRGSDGQTWELIGNFAFPVPALVETVYVGVFYSPEVGNIPPQSGERRSFLARFADYSRTGGSNPLEEVVLSIQKAANEVEISWTGSGTLQSTLSLTQPDWQNAGSVSPHRTTPQGARFYRVLVAE